jgi:DNA-binding NarL/FixJ family response regulator
MKILVIDDHAVVRHGLKRILEDEFPGVIFGEAGSPHEALELVRNQKWNLVILDISLPGRDGLEVLKDIHAECHRLPVIIFSSYPEEQFVIRTFKAGAVGYLTKESAPEQMGMAVRKVLAGGRYVSPALAEHLAGKFGGEPTQPAHEMLSDREYQILRMIGAGKTVTAIGEELSLSVKTVSTYRVRILDKLHLTTTAELICYFFENGLKQ